MSFETSDLPAGQFNRVPTIAQQRTSQRPSPATVWRWCKKGLRGGRIKLRAIYHSGQWHTTAEAFDEFLNAQTEAAFSQNEKPVEDVSDADLRAQGLL